MIDQRKADKTEKEAGAKVDEAARSAKSAIRAAREDVEPLRESAEAFATSLQQAADQATEAVRDQLEKRPFVVLGVAAGVGYVLGGGLPTFLTRALVRIGLRAATTAAVGRLVATLSAEE